MDENDDGQLDLAEWKAHGIGGDFEALLEAHDTNGMYVTLIIGSYIDWRRVRKSQTLLEINTN